MNFQPLARTWRPRRFEDLIGQAHVVRALSYALDQNQLHHALLFSGTRGVGKTTLARIIAKCLNCEHGVSSQPCRDDDAACTTCREIDSGRFVDLIEVDAASRTGVDDTRALMDNVAYAPTAGRTKVYLIDEVHMLTKHSFNALLKTFEEPPPGVEFVLATTEPEKIPVTILSRCLQFPLKRLPAPQIVEKLTTVSRHESLEADDEAIELIAQAADGSMRDGLSLVDQGLAFGGGRLDTTTVHEMLGSVAGDRIQALVASVVDADAAEAMRLLDGLYADGIDTRYILDAMATAWQRLATIQIVGAPVDESDQPWQTLADRADPAAVQVFYDISVAGIRDLAYAPDPLVGTRMTLLRLLAFQPGDGRATEPSNEVVQTEARDQRSTTPSTPPPSAAQTQSAASDDHTRPAGVNEAVANQHSSIDESGESAGPAGPSDDPEPTDNESHADRAVQAAIESTQATMTVDNEAGVSQSSPPATDERAHRDTSQSSRLPADWHTLMAQLDIGGLSAQLASNAVCERLDEVQIDLILSESRRFLLTSGARAGLTEALTRLWGAQTAPPHLSIRVADTHEDTDDTPAERSQRAVERAQDAAREAIENDPFVNTLKQRLGANVRPESIQPARDSRANQ